MKLQFFKSNITFLLRVNKWYVGLCFTFICRNRRISKRNGCHREENKCDILGTIMQTANVLFTQGTFTNNHYIYLNFSQKQRRRHRRHALLCYNTDLKLWNYIDDKACKYKIKLDCRWRRLTKMYVAIAVFVSVLA